jgi:hypothetical protein
MFIFQNNHACIFNPKRNVLVFLTRILCVFTFMLTCHGNLLAVSSVVIDQYPPKTYANTALNTNITGSNISTQQIADDFVLPGDSLVNRISWSGFYADRKDPYNLPDLQFVIRFYKGDSPDINPIYSTTVHATFNITGQTDFFNDSMYDFSAELNDPLMLHAGERYWLSVLDADPATTTNFRWLESANSYNHTHASRPIEGYAWYVFTDRWDCAYTIESIPEPSALVLVVLGACILLPYAWYKKRK